MSESKKVAQLRVALVYDRVNKFGGAERLLQVLHQAFPNAPLYTSMYDSTQASWAKGWDVRTTFLQKLKPLRRHHELLGMGMSLAFEQLDFSEYDVVISVTSEAAKGILTKPETRHICWMLTPTRYLWSGAEQYVQDYFSGWRRILRPVYRWCTQILRTWDLAASSRPDEVIAISQVVAKRVQKYYKRQCSRIIYPPVDTEFFRPAESNAKLPTPFLASEPFFLVVSRLVPYKRVELAVQACLAEKLNLVVIGQGSELSRLKKLAQGSSRVRFLGHLTDRETLGYYQACQSLVFPGEDDFGLTVLEALACGKPPVVFARSGNAEVVLDGQQGVLFTQQSVVCLREALRRVQAHTWSSGTLRQQAVEYDVKKCIRQWKELVYGTPVRPHSGRRRRHSTLAEVEREKTKAIS